MPYTSKSFCTKKGAREFYTLWVLNSYRNFTPPRFNKRNNIKVLFVYNKEGYWREAKKECKSVTESDDNNYNVGDSPEHDLGVM